MAIQNQDASKKKKNTNYYPGYNLGIDKATAQASVPKNNLPTNTQKTTTSTTSTKVDTSSYDRGWNQNQAQFNLQASQLDESYKMALNQLTEQEREEENQTGRLAQQSYLAREKAEKVLPNQLGMMGAANTGYENVARQNIAQQYNNQFEQYMYNLNLAKAAIKRSRESQEMNYNQNKASLDLNRQQAYDDYAYSKSQAISKASSSSKTSGSASKPNFDAVVQQALAYGTPDRASEYLLNMVDQKAITKADANRIYNEFGQYWSYYNQ